MMLIDAELGFLLSVHISSISPYLFTHMLKMHAFLHIIAHVTCVEVIHRNCQYGRTKPFLNI